MSAFANYYMRRRTSDPTRYRDSILAIRESSRTY